jgi:uncharacterized integral membrane protein
VGNILSNLKGQFGNITFAPNVLQAGVIIVLIFLLILFMARMTRTYLSWYTGYWYVWVGLGFFLAVIVEGFFVVSGSTVFTSILGWKTAPKPIQFVVDTGRSKLINVLGAKDSIPTSESVISSFNALEENERINVKNTVCNE